MRDGAIVISRRMLATVALALAATIVVITLALVPGPRDAAARVLSPRGAADPATVAQQRTAAEHSIQRGYAKATRQLRQVRELTLAISRAEADAIDAKARADLREIRRQALGALGSVGGVPGPRLADYVTAAEEQLERQFDQGSLETEPGLLLAPSLFDIVRRADQLFQQIADTATRQLTGAPATPSATARPGSPSPSASPPSR